MQFSKLFKFGDVYSPNGLYEPFLALDELFIDKVILYTALSVPSNKKVLFGIIL